MDGLRCAVGGARPGQGLFYGGGLEVGKQALGTVAVLSYSFVVALLIGLAVKATMCFRVSKDAEETGVDVAIHAETAYHSASSPGRAFRPLGSSVPDDRHPESVDEILVRSTVEVQTARRKELVGSGAAKVSP